MSEQHPDNDRAQQQAGARGNQGGTQRGAQYDKELNRNHEPGYPNDYPGDYPEREYIGSDYERGRERWGTEGGGRWPDHEGWEGRREQANPGLRTRDDMGAPERSYRQPSRGYGYYRAGGLHPNDPGYQDQDFGSGRSNYRRPEWRGQDHGSRGNRFDPNGADRDYGLQGYGRGGYAEDYGSGRGAEMYRGEWTEQQAGPYGEASGREHWGDQDRGQAWTQQRQAEQARQRNRWQRGQPYDHDDHQHGSMLGDDYMADRGRQWGAFGGAGWSMGPSSGGDYQRGNLYAGHRNHSHRGRGPKGYVRSDERIREDICERLTHDHHVDASDIHVECENGIVTLTGKVERRRIKHYVEDLVESVPSVKDVDNRLKVHHSWLHLGRDHDEKSRTASDDHDNATARSESQAGGKSASATDGNGATRQ